MLGRSLEHCNLLTVWKPGLVEKQGFGGIELVSWWMKCGLSLNSLNLFALFPEKYAQRARDASQELERVK